MVSPTDQDLPAPTAQLIQQLADDSNLSACISGLDASIAALKTRIASQVNSSRAVIAQAPQRAAALLESATQLTTRVDSIKDEFYDPENGLAEQLMAHLRRRNSILTEQKSLSRTVELLADLDKVRRQVEAVESALGRQEWVPASHAIVEGVRSKQNTATIDAYECLQKRYCDAAGQQSRASQQVAFYVDALAHFDQLKNNLLQDMERQVEERFTFEQGSAGQSQLMMDGRVADGSVVRSQLELIAQAARNVGEVKSALQGFAQVCLECVLVPCIGGASAEFTSDGALVVTQRETHDDVFTNALSALAATHQLFPDGVVDLLQHQLFVPFSDRIVSNYLAALVPSQPSEFARFAAVAELAIQFEEQAKSRSLAPGGHHAISGYVASVDALYVSRRQNEIFAAARRLLVAPDYEDVLVSSNHRAADQLQSLLRIPDAEDGASDQEERQYEEHLQVQPCPPFPQCRVSHTVIEYTQLITRTIQEQLRVPQSWHDSVSWLCHPMPANNVCDSAPRLRSVCRDLVELYRAISFARYESTKTIPSQAMLYHNDLRYLADFVAAWALLDSGLPSHIDLVWPLAKTAVSVFQEQITIQRGVLAENFADFPTQLRALHRHAEELSDAFAAVTFQLEELRRRYQPILPRHLTAAALGTLYDGCLRHCLDEILSWEDITAKESQDLNVLFQGLLPAAFLFIQLAGDDDDDDGVSPSSASARKTLPTAPTSVDEPPLTLTRNQIKLVSEWVPSFELYYQATAIMVLSFRDIMERLRHGDYHCFHVNDLLRLVRALFQDSDLRRRNVNEILHSATQGLVQSG
ncbi:ribosome biogenesis protein ytm1 [Sorochytrium milnesiophthora]